MTGTPATENAWPLNEEGLQFPHRSMFRGEQEVFLVGIRKIDMADLAFTSVDARGAGA